jgi:hypothetical protein
MLRQTTGDPPRFESEAMFKVSRALLQASVCGFNQTIKHPQTGGLEVS